ncbi:DinB family protein [Pseudonocardia kongjuensis]|uniref:DinB family protein n=1 Tax=Pseudonocardia kongjuensis TaxID=102227 RepID=A0ABN1XPN4_9PSEU
MDDKETLRGYLQTGREVMLWKLDGLGEYDVRRPLVPSGTNLLGLVKHLALVEAGYLGSTFGRPFPDAPAWMEQVWTDPVVDLFAAPGESRADVVDLYRRVWAHSDATVAALAPDAEGTVPHWPAERATVTLHRVLVHLVAETHRHAGHADILRETVDGAIGHRAEVGNLADEATSPALYDRIDAAARAHRG